MNRWIMAAALCATASISACGSQESHNDDSLHSTEVTQEAQEAQEARVAPSSQLGFAPQLLEDPVVGVYTPGFPYSVRSISNGAGTAEGASSLSLEFWGVTTADANRDVMQALIASGYRVESESEGGGSYSVRYLSDEGSRRLLVNVSPIGERERTAPNSVGTVYFEWSF